MEFKQGLNIKWYQRIIVNFKIMMLQLGFCKRKKISYLLGTHTEVSIGEMIWCLCFALKHQWGWEWGYKVWGKYMNSIGKMLINIKAVGWAHRDLFYFSIYVCLKIFIIWTSLKLYLYLAQQRYFWLWLSYNDSYTSTTLACQKNIG